jgi:hypothetical protein
VVQEFPDGGRVLMVLPDDKQAMKKVSYDKELTTFGAHFLTELKSL